MAKQTTLYPFVSKLFTLVSDPDNGAYISWSDNGDQFTVWAPSEFSTNVLPRYFKHNNFCSFIRQLNIYGFHKCDADSWVFKHEEGFFIRGNADLLQKIQRRKQTNKRSAPSSSGEEEMSNKVPKLTVDATPSAAVNQPMTMNRPAEKSEDVAYLRTVNDFVIAELNTLKRKNQTQENTIAWLIQELLRSKKEMDEVKRVMKKFSLTDDEGSKSAPTQNPLGSQLQQLQELHTLHVQQQQQQQQQNQVPQTPQTPGVKMEQQWMGGMDESHFFTVPNPTVSNHMANHNQTVVENQGSNESQYMVEMFPLDIQGAPLPGYGGYNS